jgi:dephospho-CoA kinase
LKRVVGLTGGIGSGKSTVAAEFTRLGAAVVDTDAIARALTTAGGAAIPGIRAAFGDGFITAEGALDRAAMRRAAFEDPAARTRLEAILHPAIRARADEALERAPGAYALIDVPLLFETRGYMDRVWRTLVVDCPEETQASRVMARSGLAEHEVRAIMAAQWPRWRRLQMADDVVSNAGSPDAIAPQCARLHEFYSREPR